MFLFSGPRSIAFLRHSGRCDEIFSSPCRLGSMNTFPGASSTLWRLKGLFVPLCLPSVHRLFSRPTNFSSTRLPERIPLWISRYLLRLLLCLIYNLPSTPFPRFPVSALDLLFPPSTTTSTAPHLAPASRSGPFSLKAGRSH